MAKTLSEKAIYKRVGTSDFSALSSKQLESFTLILHRISPEQAIQLMNQFSDFRMSANKMVGFLRMRVLKSRKLRKKSSIEIRTSCIKQLEELDSCLSKSNFSSSDKVFVEHRIIMLACLSMANNKERSRKTLKVLALVSAGAIALAGALCLLVYIFSKSENDNDDDETDDPSSPDSDDDYDEYDEYFPYIPDDKIGDPYYEPFTDPDNPLYLGPFEGEDDPDFDDYDDEDYDESDESYAAEDYIHSRPWGIDNEGYWDENCLF